MTSALTLQSLFDCQRSAVRSRHRGRDHPPQRAGHLHGVGNESQRRQSTALIAFSKFNKIIDGQILVFFIIAIAAAEVAVGLADHRRAVSPQANHQRR